MPSIRIGFGSDFSVSGANVGIGTTFANTKLQVSGAAKADFNITGVTTLTAYSGFVAEKQNISDDSKIGFNTIGVGTLTQYYETESEYTKLENFTSSSVLEYKSLSGDLIVDDGKIFSIQDTEMVGFTTIGEYNPHTHKSSVCLGSLENLSVRNHFSVPCGEINDRQNNPIEGSVRFNDDLNTLEFYNGIEWKQFTYNQGQSSRAVFGGGTVPSLTNTMEYVQISTFGNALDFGDLVGTTENPGGCSSSTRGLFSGGRNPGQLDRMDYITIASAGNAIDFGNLTDSGRIVYNAVSSSTRGINLGGYKTSSSANINTIDYVELPTLGNALDFGDVTTTRRSGGDCSSPTRGIYAGGFASVSVSVIEFLSIASKGNTVRFGELTFRGYGQTGCSNPIRGIFAGGNQDGGSSGYRSEISYITIASEGNATYFGDLAVARGTGGSASNSIRGVFAGGYTPTLLSSIETISISEGGSALDFGDLSGIRRGMSGVSDSHGGLGGF